MKNFWVISDTHFSHTNSWEKFKLADGSPLRPFTSTEEMDETMVERWNAVVKPNDHVYHLGDVAISKRGLEYVRRLNGHKRLIRGNHDIHSDKLYREVGFEQIHGVRVFVDKWIFSHIPLHPSSVTGRFRVNVHGHLHAGFVPTIASVGPGITDCEYTNEPDPRYFCACVEQVNYTPVSFDELEVKIQERWERCYYTPPQGWFNGSGPG